MRNFLSLGAVTFAGLVWLVSGASAAEAPRPNIVLILADDMGFSDVGAFGGEIKTPNIDKLAAGGKIFTQFYNTARCCPSRASLLTGLYPHQAGIGHLIYKTPHIGYGDYLTSDSMTIAQVLRRAGYSTYMLGKWHLAPRSYDPKKDVQYWPTRRGFDKFYGTINGSGSFFDPSTLTRGSTYISPQADPEYKPEQFYYTDAITDNAVKFLKEHKAEAGDKPFFMYVAYTASHWPLQAPEDAIAPYRGKYDAGYEAVHAAREKRLKELGLLPEVGDTAPPVGKWADVKNKKLEAALMETYAGMASRMDQGIGKILDELRAAGELDNTLVIYLQDNGACAEDPFAVPRPDRKPIPPMKPDEIQTDAQPKFTREGKPVRTGHDVMPGPADTLTAYLENWANVSNTPFRLYKHFVHEGGISTPLIAYWPAGIHATSETKVIRTPAHLVDIMPTVIELAGARYPERKKRQELQPLQGVSLAGALTSGTAIERGKPLFWEHEGNRAVRDGKWKLVAISEEGAWELYDMEHDRGETHDLAAQHPDIVKKMADQWQKWAATHRVLPLGGWRDRVDMKAPQRNPARGVEKVVLKQGDVLVQEKSLDLINHGIKLQVEVLSGPVEGVLVAQGASVDGFSVYAKEGKMHLTANMGRTRHDISTEIPAETPFQVEATIDAEGRATLKVGEKSVTESFGSTFQKNPLQGISAGFDSETPAGAYPVDFKFQGKIGPVTGEILK
jgi:arylsulfatase